MSGKHTEGPWSWHGDKKIDRLIGKNGERVLDADEYAGASWIIVSEANARLIEAAPELIQAAKRFFILEVETCNCDVCAGWASELKAAISKAEGSRS